MSYPFPSLVNEFFLTTKLCYSQTMPMVWKILQSLSYLNETRNLSIGLPEISSCYQLRTHGNSRFVLQSRNGKLQMIPRSTHDDADWKRRFFFVKRSSIPGGMDLPQFWVKKAVKFETLVETKPDSEEKLKLLFEIPARERACASEIVTSESNFSTNHTVSMSSTPKPTSKFSFADIKAKVNKKEKADPIPVVDLCAPTAPASKPEASGSKKRKASAVRLNLATFEGLDEVHTASKLRNLLELGVERFVSLADQSKKRLQDARETVAAQYERELKEAQETIADMRKLAEHKDKYYKDKEDVYSRLLDEINALKASHEVEKKQLVEDAKNSATISVLEAMIEMAEEAASEKYSHAHWDLEGWREHLQNMVDPEETCAESSKAAEKSKKTIDKESGNELPEAGTSNVAVGEGTPEARAASVQV